MGLVNRLTASSNRWIDATDGQCTQKVYWPLCITLCLISVHLGYALLRVILSFFFKGSAWGCPSLFLLFAPLVSSPLFLSSFFFSSSSFFSSSRPIPVFLLLEFPHYLYISSTNYLAQVTHNSLWGKTWRDYVQFAQRAVKVLKSIEKHRKQWANTDTHHNEHITHMNIINIYIEKVKKRFSAASKVPGHKLHVRVWHDLQILQNAAYIHMSRSTHTHKNPKITSIFTFSHTYVSVE